MSERIRKNDVYHWLFLVGFLLVLALCVFKAPLEIQGDDEAFYLTVPKRLTDGDIFVIDEWHGSQFAGFLMYPFMLLHRILFGFDGVVLHFRYLYVFFQAIFAIVIYLRLREYKLFAILASLFFFIFTPYDIMSMSYNTMGLMLVTISGTLMATSKSDGYGSMFVSGLIFAGAVLCCPYLLVIYLIYTAGALIYIDLRGLKTFKGWLAFSLGAGTLAVLFLGLVMTRTSLQGLFAAIPNLFTDPEHTVKPFYATVRSYFIVIGYAYPHTTVLFSIYFFALAEAVIDKKRSEHRMFYLTVAAVIALVMVIGCLPTVLTNSYNYIMFPMALVGLMAHVVTRQKNHKLFVFLFLGGLLYSMCIHFSSNQHIYAISMASTAANVGSIALIGGALSERERDKRVSFANAAAVLIIVLIVCQLLLMVYVKINHKFASYTENSAFTQTIEVGPYKGLRVTPETQDKYLAEYASLQPLMDKEGSVLYACDITWYYLATPQLKIGAYSAWLSGYRESTIERLKLFYGLYPDKLPEYLLIPLQHRWDLDLFKREIIDRYGYQLIGEDGAMIYAR